MTRLLDWGVDGIISDRPDVAAAVVSARASRQS
jgi:glycerophosphoryl diester phosphodiesterase